LEPVALLPDLGDATMCLWYPRVLKAGHRWNLIGRAHVDPDDVPCLVGGVRLGLDLVFEIDWFVHLVDTVAVHIELPSVIDTTKPAFLVATQEQGSESVRAIFVQNPNIAIGVTEPDEILAK
jgi:hypothetical protein